MAGSDKVGFIAIDISASKNAQEAERHLPAIIESSNDAILGIELDLTITSWNAAAEKLYGYSRDEAVGKSVLMLVPEERRDEEPEILRKVSGGKGVGPYETQRHRRQSSRFLWLSTSSRRMLQSTAHCRLPSASSRSPGGLATVMRGRKQGYI
jgi:PAS domain S-box-containing protein